MKKIYLKPELQIARIGSERPIAQSNQITETSIIFNTTTMVGADGSDAVKSNTYSVWDDDWSE